MPVHDWTRVDAGIFHDFHQSWIIELKGALNQGRLPPDYYALAEQIAGGRGPDVLKLQAPPRVQFHLKSEGDWYAAKANTLVIRHVSGHRVVAVLEIVSPGNKGSAHGLRAFVTKAVELLPSGIHLLVVDLFRPGSRDPQGIHKPIWDEFIDNDFRLPESKPLTLAGYAAGSCPEAFVEPTAVGSPLVDMPLFLSPEVYVLVPLELAYEAAWKTVPSYWRDVLERVASGDRNGEKGGN